GSRRWSIGAASLSDRDGARTPAPAGRAAWIARTAAPCRTRARARAPPCRVQPGTRGRGVRARGDGRCEWRPGGRKSRPTPAPADELLGAGCGLPSRREALPHATPVPGPEPSLPRERLAGRDGADSPALTTDGPMDHYIPKRRVAVTLWSSGLDAVAAQLFLDLDPTTRNHQTVLEKLNESSPFLPAAVGEEGRIHLFNKRLILRVTPARSVILADVFSRGFRPWREEEAELALVDGTAITGRVWMPLDRETQRLSDYMNQVSGY